MGITEETSIVDKDGKLLQEVNGKDVSRRNIKSVKERLGF